MTLAAISSREAVLSAIAEFDSIGREAFLDRYGFGRARSFLLVHEGKQYDSKAIAGAAHGYEFPDLGPLRSDEFSGGASGAAAKLESLGFVIESESWPAPAVPGVWWVNQGTTYESARDGGYIWAPQTTVNGQTRSFHSAVAEVQRGDVVLHYAQGAVRAIGAARGELTVGPEPPRVSGDQSERDGWRSDVKYFELDNPIPLAEFPARSEDVGPFDRLGGVKQGYLYSLDQSWAASVRQGFADRWPTGSPWSMKQERSAVEELNNQTNEDRFDSFLEWALRFRNGPTFDQDEYDYKVEIAARLRAAIEAMGRQDPEWDLQFKRAFGAPNNLTNFRVHGPFIEWAIARPTETVEAIDRLWSSDRGIAERVDEFEQWLPVEVASGPSSRLSLTSLMLLAENPYNWPMYRWTAANTFTDLLERPRLPEPLGNRYAAFVELMQEFVERSATADGGPLRNRLDAQSACWSVSLGSPLADWDAATKQRFQAFRYGTEDSVIAAAVDRFRQDPDTYTAVFRTKFENQRMKLAEMLTPEALQAAVDGTDTKIFGWLHSQAFGAIGGAGLRVSAAVQAGHGPEIAQAFRDLLYGDGTIEERIDAVVNATPAIEGMSEPVANKVLAAVDPDEWIPYYTSGDRYGRAALAKHFGLGDFLSSPSTERFIASNTALREALQPYFSDDTIGMRAFLWFVRLELESGQLEPNAVEKLAEDLFLPVSFVSEILDLLQDKGQMIFYGPPGTGKTFVAMAIAEHLTDSDAIELVQFHPSYAYEDFVEGYRPTESGSFVLKPGPLRRIAQAAIDDPGRQFILIIDEINRGNVAKVFGEMYFLLEYRDRTIQLQYSDTELQLPRNLSIIGTMNSADRSIGLIDGALRRRFYFTSFYPSDPALAEMLPAWLAQHAPSLIWISDVLNRANELLADRHLHIGPSHFLRKDLTVERIEQIWKYSVLPYIGDQFFGREHEMAKFELAALRAHGVVQSDVEADDAALDPAD